MKALILVDLQNEFMPGGALAVNAGDEVVPIANRLLPCFDLVVATQDWHPADHLSFAGQHPGHRAGDCIELEGLQQILWPDHCVQGTAGAELNRYLNISAINRVIRKGTHRNIDSYSGFFDNGHRQGTGLMEYLKQKHVDDVYFLGLATDYCVKYTALDAVSLGFKAHLIEDGCRGVELQDGNIASALEELRFSDVEVTNSNELLEGHSS